MTAFLKIPLREDFQWTRHATGIFEINLFAQLVALVNDQAAGTDATDGSDVKRDA